VITEERCERTELPVSMCAHCKGQRSVEEQVKHEGTGDWIFAQDPGDCAGCGTPFKEGELIHRIFTDSHSRGFCWVSMCCEELV
jgi:hypothetical protein